MTHVTIENYNGKVYEFLYKLIVNTISGKIPWKGPHHRHGGCSAVLDDKQEETFVHVSVSHSSSGFDLAIERKDPRSNWHMIGMKVADEMDGGSVFKENMGLLRGVISIYRRRVRPEEHAEEEALHLELVQQAMTHVNTMLDYNGGIPRHEAGPNPLD